MSKSLRKFALSGPANSDDLFAGRGISRAATSADACMGLSSRTTALDEPFRLRLLFLTRFHRATGSARIVRVKVGTQLVARDPGHRLNL